VQAAIELLDDIFAGTPAEKALTAWARRSRFAGSKDRRAVRDHVYQALRCHRSYTAHGGAETGRGVMLGAIRAGDTDPDQVFSGVGHAPAPLSEAERTAPVGTDPQAHWNLPDWLIERFQSDLAEQALPTAQALTERAPTMLRVNLRKSDVAEAIAKLAAEQITAVDDPIAMAALRVTEGAPRLQMCGAYLEGLVELQDGSSQAAMEAVSIPQGAKVLDYCAGGGGKTLALAGRAEAEWFAHDVQVQRMADMVPRSTRAGVRITQLQAAELSEHAPYDVVLCDVPCSGSGTWRRTPHAKWNFTPSDLDRLVAIQGEILENAASFVGRDGSLIYATCSVLSCENTDQITAFMKDNPEWDCRDKYQWPVAQNGDGFFVARLERVGL
jgi:16S rRNA (cytosine967-C5)-methyltransferase